MRVSAERLSAYRGSMARLGYEIRPGYVQSGDFLQQSGYDAMQRLLDLDEPPDAVAAACDAMAVGAIRAIEDAGLRCPADIAVTGFDDAPWAASLEPALTTVRQPAAEMGSRRGGLRRRDGQRADPRAAERADGRAPRDPRIVRRRERLARLARIAADATIR